MKKQESMGSITSNITEEGSDVPEKQSFGSNQEMIEKISLDDDIESSWEKHSFLSRVEGLGIAEIDELADLWATTDDKVHERLRVVLTGPCVVCEIDPLLETIDPRHRYELSSWLRKWSALGAQGDFFAYVDNFPRCGIKACDPPGTDAEVAYLDDEQRKAYQLDVSGGLSWTTHNEDGVDGDLIFVLSTDGLLYGGNKERDTNNELGKRFHHTSFLSGLPVTTAGMMTVKSGTVTRISGHSGHYQPRPMAVWTGLLALDKAGLSLDGVLVKPKIGDDTEVDAKKFLESGPPKE
jgi:hypothetical protein